MGHALPAGAGVVHAATALDVRLALLLPVLFAGYWFLAWLAQRRAEARAWDERAAGVGLVRKPGESTGALATRVRDHLLAPWDRKR